MRRSPLDVLREHSREVEGRLRRPVTPLDILRLANLRSRLRASRKRPLKLVRGYDVDNWV